MFEAARDAGKINASYKIMFENQKKKRKYGNKKKFIHTSTSKRLFIHSPPPK